MFAGLQVLASSAIRSREHLLAHVTKYLHNFEMDIYDKNSAKINLGSEVLVHMNWKKIVINENKCFHNKMRNNCYNGYGGYKIMIISKQFSGGGGGDGRYRGRHL